MGSIHQIYWFFPLQTFSHMVHFTPNLWYTYMSVLQYNIQSCMYIFSLINVIIISRGFDFVWLNRKFKWIQTYYSSKPSWQTFRREYFALLCKLRWIRLFIWLTVSLAGRQITLTFVNNNVSTFYVHTSVVNPLATCTVIIITAYHLRTTISPTAIANM